MYAVYALLTEHRVDVDKSIPQVVVKSTRHQIAEIADRFYSSPSKGLNLIGITGTNGKTTVTDTGHTGLENPEPVVKVDLDRKKLTDVEVKFVYKIRVTNEGEIAGYATEITEDINNVRILIFNGKEIQNKDYKEVDDALDEIDISHFKKVNALIKYCNYNKDNRVYSLLNDRSSHLYCNYNCFPTYLIRHFLDQNNKEREKLQIMTKIFDVNIDVILKILSFVPINTSEHSKLINKFKYFSEKLNDKKLSSNDKERCKNESKEFINDMETIVKLHNKWLD